MARRLILPLAICVALCGGGLAHAGINSGGGRTALGTESLFVSIGQPFAATPAVVGSEQIFPGAIEVLFDIEPSGVDTDDDGIPDAWGNFHFGQANINDEGDDDGDGTSNLTEFLAGTDPKSAASVFRPQAAIEAAEFILRFNTFGSRRYEVLWSADLQNWSPLETMIGNGAQASVEFTASQDDPDHATRTGDPKYFFRVRVSKR